MADTTDSGKDTDSGEDFTRSMAEIASRSQALVRDWLTRQAEGGGLGHADPLNVGEAFFTMTQHLMREPHKIVQAQFELWQDYMALWQNTTRRLMGEEVEPTIAPHRDDRRFKDAAWEENNVFDFIKQSYLLTARWMQNTVREVEGMDEQTSKKVDFYTRQFVDALAPSNFVMTNPEVLRETLDSNGENLMRGLRNLLDDLERGEGQLRIKMTDHDAFEVGGNLATTPGKVVFQNDLIQLLQFEPMTEKVLKRPLMIVPPWINKYYILDLREKNSFIRWAVQQGHTVFCISWVNPDAKLAEKTFEDYMFEGVLAALKAVCDATGEDKANVIGYCLGGTLLASTLAYMAKKGDDRVATATYFTSLVDFSDPGELGVFIDEAQLESLEERMGKRGYLEGSEMATTFNMLRANDLIWSFVVNNYLLGKDPFPFDLLYWNSDSTRMPAAMHSFYLRRMYIENRLSKPGGITLGGVPIDVRKISTPTFILSTREDHIAPWQTTYTATQLYSGPVTFTLAASGHIAGVVNPPAAEKYSHWTNPKCPPSPDDWLAGATEHKGSWWPEWHKWVSNRSRAKTDARKPGDGKLKPIEDAPGSYVKVRVG
jgi:polyhydroxyalkanoate synthase